MSDPRARLPGLIALNCVTVIWGSQHAVIKHLVTSAHAAAPPTVINFFRFSLAAVTTGIISACRRGRTRFTDAPHTNVLRASAELALWQVLGFTLQLVGLQWTSASRSAFLLYLNAVLVPFFACVLGERRVGLRTWVAAFAAVSGTLLLTYDGGPPNVGDVWSLCAAAASALYIVRLSALSAGVESTRLSAVTLALTTAACMALPVAQAALSPAGFVGLAEQAAALLRHGWPALLYLSTVVTATRRAISPDLARSRPASPASPSEPPHRVPASSNLLQTFGQQRVGASEAAIIYTMDPVYGALFAWLLLGEQLHAQGYAGIGLVLCANLLRRLPWGVVAATRRLLTPFPSQLDLAAMSPAAAAAAATGDDARCEPLLPKGQGTAPSTGAKE
eukprot:Transcript_15758.p1 GENE.Transcript_15758~~Transcript_15758.p1  ORF type:complete len:391 (-),score=126.03 Transcript_15758:805-1977(-)